MRPGLRAGVTGAAGGAGASAVITGRSGNQFLHALPQQPRLRRTAGPTCNRVSDGDVVETVLTM